MADAVVIPLPKPQATRKKREQGLTAEDARIFAEMFEAGAKAIAAYRAPDTGACGYATLRVISPKKMAAHFRDAGFVRAGRGVYARGVTCPGYQSLDAHEHVAKAMAASLIGNGVDAYAIGRLD